MNRKIILAPVAYVLALIGTVIGLSFIGAIIWDVSAAEHGRTTISEWFMAASIHKKILVCLIALINAIVWGALFAHLVWAKNGNPTFWIVILIITLVGLVIGGIFGNYFFGQ